MSGKYLVIAALVVLSGCRAKPLGRTPIDGSSPDRGSPSDGPARGFVVPDCGGAASGSSCPVDDGGAGQDARPADANSYPPPFADAGCTGDPRNLVLYCETLDQLLGTDAGAAVTSVADCPPESVLASPQPCALGEGSCCMTPACGPQIEQVGVSLPTPDASGTENRCCYLVQVVCGV
jgi:hypothetical protein